MAAAQPIPTRHLSVDEYLAFEESSPTRHEYVDGELFAFAGGTWDHNEIAGNVYATLRLAARALGCRAAMADMRLAIRADRVYYYPDVIVTCEPSGSGERAVTEPLVVVEVLLDSTQRIDREAKLMACRNIESLHHYLIIHQHERHIEWHFRDDLGSWQRIHLRDEGNVTINQLSCTLTLDDIFEAIDLE